MREYLVQELTAAGLEVEVQRTGGLENVVARLRGSDPTGAIIVLTHYDTVPGSAGAGDNSSAVAAQLEIMRALSAGVSPRNDVIALFHDGEEYPGIMDGTKAFIRKHPWMKDVRVAISIDSAVAGFISTVEVGPKNNGWLVHALSRAYSGGGWMSFSGGGVYNSTPFREAGIPVLALEDGYPFRQKHTEGDVPQIINAGSVQQLGEQTLAITRVLGELDLANPWGEQETFFSVPVIGFIHYPEAWSIPLAIAAGLLLVLGLGLVLWRRFVSWRGLAIALVAILVTAALAVIGIDKLRAGVTDLMGWETAGWEEWPEVIPALRMVNRWSVWAARLGTGDRDLSPGSPLERTGRFLHDRADPVWHRCSSVSLRRTPHSLRIYLACADRLAGVDWGCHCWQGAIEILAGPGSNTGSSAACNDVLAIPARHYHGRWHEEPGNPGWN